MYELRKKKKRKVYILFYKSVIPFYCTKYHKPNTKKFKIMGRREKKGAKSLQYAH